MRRYVGERPRRHGRRRSTPGGAEEDERSMRSVQRLGLVAVLVAAGAWTTWLGWRLDRAVEHPLALALFLLEMAGAAGGLGAALVFARPAPRAPMEPDTNTTSTGSITSATGDA